jgi:hypothetical protein
MATQNRRGAKRAENQSTASTSNLFSNLSTFVLLAVLGLVIYGGGLLYKHIDKRQLYFFRNRRAL